MKHKPYPKYKPSGIDWIGDIPEGWEVLPIKRIVEIPVTDGPHETPEILDDGIPFVSAEAVKNEKLDFSKKRGYISLEEHKRFSRKYKPKKGDIYMVKSGATTGNIALVETEEEFNIWSPLAVIRLDGYKMDSMFVFNFMKSKSFFQSVELAWSFGTQQNIGMGVIENLPITIPSLREQKIIADFLDQKTAQIDDLIQKKEEMIKLLKEKRAAIINQAVTKGLNPNAKMKPSGIDWIGDIPEGWQVLRLKYKISLDPSKNEVLKIISLDDDVTFLPMAYVTEGGDINDENEKKLEDVFSGYTYFRDNDVVVAKITPCFENGKGALITGMKNGIGFGTTEFFVLRSKSLDEKYLFYLTKSDYFRKIGEASMKGAAGQKRIPDSFIKDFNIGFPEQTEQKRIANYLDKKTIEIDGLIQKIESAIARLREYRSSLITAAVTGKIDVRG